MRDIPPGLQAAIDDEVTSLAFCWRVERADGVAIGFTSHDRAIDIGGVTYAASPGMTPSAVSVSDDVEGGGMEIAGALTGAAIRAADIADGRYDGARVELSLADWRSPGSGAVTLASGSIGDIERRGDGFEAELRTVQAQLSAIPVELCSPECRARLGDARCRVDLGPRTRIVRVVAVQAENAITVDASADENIYAYGRLRPLAGRRAGLDHEIIASDAAHIEIGERIAFDLAAGDLVELREGCDRRYSTCRDRFANKDNFRGEPHVPGTDSIIRYPSL